MLSGGKAGIVLQAASSRESVARHRLGHDLPCPASEGLALVVQLDDTGNGRGASCGVLDRAGSDLAIEPTQALEVPGDLLRNAGDTGAGRSQCASPLGLHRNKDAIRSRFSISRS